VTGWAPQTAAVGVGWDAVRIPVGVGMALWKRLVADGDTHDRVGPVVVSERSRAVYWLIPTGSSSSWPDGCRLLACGSHLLLPGPHAHPRDARWLHQPHISGQLTGAVWLAAALNDHLNQGGTPMSTGDLVPCRPWRLTLEVEHLGGPPFELDRHGEAIETEIIERLADVVVHLAGGTSVRVETYMDRTTDMELRP